MKTNSRCATASCLSGYQVTRITGPWAPWRNGFKLLFLIALTALGCLSARASDPIGIYALIDKVVLEPNDTAPERIQIWGTFSLAKPGGAQDQYEAPQRGYLYYKLNPEQKSASDKEWSDLKSVAGSKQCVAFASRYQAKGHVRPSDEPPAKPDEYPVAHGLTRVRQSNYAPVKKLLEVASAPQAKPEHNPVTTRPNKAE
jgi:hypothetical protein